MSHRSPPQRSLDDTAFPLRVKLRAPTHGLADQLARVLQWLDEEVGTGGFAHHSGGTIGVNTQAFYFRRALDLSRFLEAFPLLELADGTTSGDHTSPHYPLGRSQE